MNRILEIGFINVGVWTFNDEALKYDLASHHLTNNVLYSFVSNGEIKYIGKTTMTLSKRMYGYQNPGPSQSTNVRVHDKIKSILSSGEPVDIFILVDNGLLKFGDFKINLAAGLEDTLIFELNPEWNYSGKKKIEIDIESEKDNLILENEKNKEINSTRESLIITLGKAYFNQGFFNVKLSESELFGYDRSQIEIQLGHNEESEKIQGYINRTANPNGAARIMGGKSLANWIQENFNIGDTLFIDIITPVSIVVYSK